MAGQLLLIPAVVCPILLIWILYATAGKLYDFHKGISDQYPRLFKAIGFNVKYINDRRSWILHYIIYATIIPIFMLLILATIAMPLVLGA